MRRIQGRVTRDDIRSAGLRRWDGRARITTDWVNLFHEPELCWPTGDCLVYLREPGQSSRGPAFRVHTAFLKVRGFEFLADRCVVRNSIHAAVQCVLPNCSGCDPQESVQELYIPAPHGASLEDIFNHHITTRNFFAWLYNRPLAGRTLGSALAALKRRIDVYRPDDSSQNKVEVLSYAENQRYLDFRECVDHALAALSLAETLQVEDLWVDAFAHCVGMSHRGLRSSIEYAVLSAKSKTLINRARLEMDIRLDRVNKSIVTFFENDVSGSFLGLPQPAREHLNKFRSFLKSFYLDRYGSWPPDDFEEEIVQQTIYSTMFSDFRNLYQHLVDPESTVDMVENDITKTGGVCTLQNIQAFDKKHSYEPLAQPLPLLPEPLESSWGQRPKLQRRMSWNPLQKRKALKETRKAHDKRALIDASNRDLLVMDCPLVRKFSEFEEMTVDDDLEGLSAIEGRKVRWILVYAVLQTFHSIAQPPKEVRNTSNLTYSLCCQPPKQKPWQESPLPQVRTLNKQSQLAPDNGYSHTNVSSSSLGETLTRGRSAKIRRRTLPANLPGSSLMASLSIRTPPASRSASLRRLISRGGQTSRDEMPSKRPSFCEIYVEGYGNGLNEVARDASDSPPAELTAEPETTENAIKEDKQEPQELPGDIVHEMAANDTEDLPPLPVSEVSATTPPSMSRESSSSSISSASSNTNEDNDIAVAIPANNAACTLAEKLKSTSITKQRSGIQAELSATTIRHRPQSLVLRSTASHVKIVDSDRYDPDLELPYVHFNTQTWDMILTQRPMTAPSPTAVAA
ncbi:uncharacterized protein Z519_06963 [Cladophialophora bantiana CBS 173.52]|uniref:DUF8004 domain-containing protein n=1 Tax=Cladophialophora bantiana (strain ATCC 10958 / CBS 173.52 / CDC B-1940 / NIH 8579) TaxID=1442370 RepID=A0A0D2EPV7_CLAB1|nr:uncharacterized protein Z519_06963 [Cladophialophora bantiana CBS 173.52]KIW91981.1 hypothetical protein Z519_06963 [Cladophialophora bantiana CBS 173.52]